VPLAVADPDKPKLKFYRTHAQGQPRKNHMLQRCLLFFFVRCAGGVGRGATGVLLRIATAWTVGWYCYLFTNASGVPPPLRRSCGFWLNCVA